MMNGGLAMVRGKVGHTRSESALERSRSPAFKEKSKVETNAMKRVAAGAHLPTPCLFEPEKRSDYCLDCSFLPPVQAPDTRFYT